MPKSRFSDRRGASFRKTKHGWEVRFAINHVNSERAITTGTGLWNISQLSISCMKWFRSKETGDMRKGVVRACKEDD